MKGSDPRRTTTASMSRCKRSSGMLKFSLLAAFTDGTVGHSQAGLLRAGSRFCTEQQLHRICKTHMPPLHARSRPSNQPIIKSSRIGRHHAALSLNDEHSWREDYTVVIRSPDQQRRYKWLSTLSSSPSCSQLLAEVVDHAVFLVESKRGRVLLNGQHISMQQLCVDQSYRRSARKDQRV